LRSSIVVTSAIGVCFATGYGSGFQVSVLRINL
jgi:hypothetical protein